MNIFSSLITLCTVVMAKANSSVPQDIRATANMTIINRVLITIIGSNGSMPPGGLPPSSSPQAHHYNGVATSTNHHYNGNHHHNHHSSGSSTTAESIPVPQRSDSFERELSSSLSGISGLSAHMAARVSQLTINRSCCLLSLLISQVCNWKGIRRNHCLNCETFFCCKSLLKMSFHRSHVY